MFVAYNKRKIETCIWTEKKLQKAPEISQLNPCKPLGQKQTKREGDKQYAEGYECK